MGRRCWRCWRRPSIGKCGCGGVSFPSPAFIRKLHHRCRGWWGDGIGSLLHTTETNVSCRKSLLQEAQSITIRNVFCTGSNQDQAEASTNGMTSCGAGEGSCHSWKRSSHSKRQLFTPRQFQGSDEEAISISKIHTSYWSSFAAGYSCFQRTLFWAGDYSETAWGL